MTLLMKTIINTEAGDEVTVSWSPFDFRRKLKRAKLLVKIDEDATVTFFLSTPVRHLTVILKVDRYGWGVYGYFDNDPTEYTLLTGRFEDASHGV